MVKNRSIIDEYLSSDFEHGVKIITTSCVCRISVIYIEEEQSKNI